MTEFSEIPYGSGDDRGDMTGEVKFSRFLTVLCLLVCLGGCVLLLWTVSTSEGVRDMTTASKDLERLSSRLLGFESRLSELSAIEQAMFHFLGEQGDMQEQVRLWYAELSHEQRGSFDELYAGTLDGEAGLKANLLESMEQWKTSSYLEPEFRQILGVVYLERNAGSVDRQRLQARLAEEVPSNWFYYHLASRLASQAGDQVLQNNLQRQFQQLHEPQLLKWRMLLFFELALAGIGFFCLGYVVVLWFKQRKTQISEKASERKYPWTFPEGVAVLVRGGALSLVLIGLLAVIPHGVGLLAEYGSLLLYLPTIVLAVVWLCRSKSQSLLAVLGCMNLSKSLGSSFPILLSGIALGLMGDWLIMLVGDAFDISVHWSEWFLSPLVWGEQIELLKMMLEIVILAPIFEEIIFRGLVLTTLRAKFNFPISLIVSAGIFALAHGYGLIAFLAVFWSGLLWAWMYERTGSIIPGICAHAINNGLVVCFLVSFFR